MKAGELRHIGEGHCGRDHAASWVHRSFGRPPARPHHSGIGPLLKPRSAVDNRRDIGECRAFPALRRAMRITSQVPENAVSQGLARARTFHRARSDPGALRPDLRAPARRLGRQRHQDRDTARARRRRAAGRPARRLRFPESASQQAQHDAQPEGAGSGRRLQAHGEEGRRGGREFPAGREAAARHRLPATAQDQSEARLCQHFRLRPDRSLCRRGRASTRSRRAWAG